MDVFASDQLATPDQTSVGSTRLPGEGEPTRTGAGMCWLVTAKMIFGHKNVEFGS